MTRARGSLGVALACASVLEAGAFGPAPPPQRHPVPPFLVPPAFIQEAMEAPMDLRDENNNPIRDPELEAALLRAEIESALREAMKPSGPTAGALLAWAGWVARNLRRAFWSVGPLEGVSRLLERLLSGALKGPRDPKIRSQGQGPPCARGVHPPGGPGAWFDFHSSLFVLRC